MTDPHADAAAAANDAGVDVRLLSAIDELAEAVAVCAAIWTPDGGEPPVNVEVLRVFQKTQNYVAGAFDRATGRMTGMAAGLRSGPDGRELHSHIAGVLDEASGRGVGFALKVQQRAWALDRGMREITWTYDPLIRRNAHLNITKLGARPTEYLEDFYGTVLDARNGADPTDRTLAAWDLLGDEVSAICRGERPALVDVDGLPLALSRDGDGPLVTAVEADRFGVAVPLDVEALRVSDPEAATAWRFALREVLGGALQSGCAVTGFAQEGVYVVERVA